MRYIYHHLKCQYYLLNLMIKMKISGKLLLVEKIYIFNIFQYIKHYFSYRINEKDFENVKNNYDSDEDN